MKAWRMLAFVAGIGATGPCCAAEKSIVLASTTSIEASGLLANILPQFKAKTGITVNVGAQGMGQALNAASAMDAYTLSDRGTWLRFNNKGHLGILVEGEARLINRYDVIELDPGKHPSAKLNAAKAFADWLVSREGQQAIGAY